MSLPGPDLINGLFEGVGALFMFRSVRQILKDKQLKGFCWSTCAFFGCWSLYNLFFYPHLNQWASTTGAALMAVANSTYVFLVIYYRHQDHKQDPLRGLSEADKNREFRSGQC